MQQPDDSPRPEIYRELSLAEAAARLGLSVDAVRKRLGRGQLAGQKHDGRWVVYLDGAPPLDPLHPDPFPAEARSATDAPAPLLHPAVQAAVARLQGDEVQWLRGRVEVLEATLLEERRAAQAERIRWLAQLEAAEARRRPWWQRWRSPGSRA